MALNAAAGLAALLSLLPAMAVAASDGGLSPDADARQADAAEPETAVDGGAVDASSSLEPPRALTDTQVPYPAGAAPQSAPVVVTVELVIGTGGAVEKVQLTTPPQPVFDAAVVVAAKAFRFAPARYGGAPIPVQITFTHTFLPPPAPVTSADAGPPRTSALRGRLVEMGTRAAVSEATVTATVAGRTYSVDVDQTGRFRLPLPPGPA